MGIVGSGLQTKKKVVWVVNSRSGNYKEEAFRKTLNSIPEKSSTEIELYYFENLEELGQKVSAALREGVQTFITAGGDGSLAILADQLRGKARIGIIPTGTGNAIARVLGIPLSMEKALKIALFSRAARYIDGLEINGKLYLMYSSIGISSSILQYMDSRWKSSYGRLAYLMGAIRHLFRADRKPVLFDIWIDGEQYQVKAAEVLVINTAPWGLGKYKIANNLIDDGRLEVCVIHKGRAQDILNGFIDLALRERKVALKYIGQGKEITVHSAQPLDVQADGDIITQTPVTIKAVPQITWLLVPDENEDAIGAG